MLWVILVAPLCYLLGSVPFPVIVSRLVAGIDLREHGSGNMGARNAGRVLGKRWFPVVMGLDFAKGATAAYLAREVLSAQAAMDPVLAASIGGLFAVIGHCFPIFVGFKGGVGLAATGGSLLVLSLPFGLTAGAALLLFWGLSRNAYVGTAAAALLYPVIGWYWLGSPAVIGVLAVWGLVVFFLHMGDLKDWVQQRKAA